GICLILAQFKGIAVIVAPLKIHPVAGTLHTSDTNLKNQTRQWRALFPHLLNSPIGPWQVWLLATFWNFELFYFGCRIVVTPTLSDRQLAQHADRCGKVIGKPDPMAILVHRLVDIGLG